MPLTITAAQVRDMAAVDEKAIADSVESTLKEIEKEILDAARRKVMTITWLKFPFNLSINVAQALGNEYNTEVRKRVEDSLRSAGFGLSYDRAGCGVNISWR